MHSEALSLAFANRFADYRPQICIHSSHKSVTVFVHGRSPSAASIKSDHMSLVLLLAASEGHVRLNYIDGSDLPIRNAGTATGNGRASVAGDLAR